MKTVGIVGYGQFGRFMAAHLSKYAQVRAFDVAGKEGVLLVSLTDVASSDLLIFAVPVQNLEEACEQVVPHVSPGALIVDVSSVKMRPLAILKAYFPDHEILGTHPIFGPQSGKDGIEGLPLVVANVSWTSEHYNQILRFLSGTLGLHVIERTPEEHDREMARVQGLTHFIGKALVRLDIQEYETGTMSYNQLIKLRELLKDDSWELFKTIENENPYAQEVREGFLTTLAILEKELKDM
ncbi:MAG: prephenate dehydrogenase [Patescibacteria group bacterium]